MDVDTTMTAASRLLIVDDDPQTRKILQRTLEGMGEVHAATSGAQALQIVADHPIDLVVLDIVMPEMDGFTTCRALLLAHPELAVIFVTVASDTADEIKALAVGGRDFISKPINPSVVRARVTLHLKLRRIEGQLRASERRFRELFEHLPVAYQSLDHQGRWLYANQAMADLMGYETPDELLGRTFGECWDAVTRDQFPDAFAALKATGSTRGELRLRRRDGSALTALLTGQVEQDETGQFRQSHCVLIDISERRAMEEAIRALNATLEQQVETRTAELREAISTLRESEARYRTLFEDTRQAVFLVEDGHFVDANRAALAMLRLERLEQLQGRTPLDFSPPLQPDGRSSAEKAVAMSRIAFEQGANEFEWTHIRADGTPITTNVIQTLIHQGDKVLLHVVWNDITDQKKALEQIAYLAYYDALTGLPNRRLGLDRLDQQVAQAQRHHRSLAILYIDLDHFNHVNDRYGHLQGDRLLQGVAQGLSRSLRAEDTLCRLAADEFMLVLPEVRGEGHLTDLADLCERLIALGGEPYDLDGHQVYVDLSIGAALYPRDGTDSETLMRHADIALYAAKRAGRQAYRFYEPGMNAALTRFIQTREALRTALERQEFVLHYQPQIALRTGRLVGVEALVRWQRPEVGLVMPGEFIDVAEESGLIVPLGGWVLREACRQAAAWRASGWPDLVMAVNVSSVQFRRGTIGAEVLAVLEETGLAPAGLEVELTESSLLEGQEEALATVAQWKARGIQLAIDDFGTGYSSLVYLKRFPVDRLKIDRSFVAGMAEHDADRAIVQAIIDMAQGLKLRTIAEGVEDAWLTSQLRFMGCDEAQGYLYAQPLPADALARWLRERERERERERTVPTG